MLYGCETWFFTLKEECRLKVFENRILRRISEPKRDVNEKWRRLHSEELLSLYRWPNIVRMTKSRKLRWAGHVARMEEGRRACKILTGKPTGKLPLGEPRRRREDNIIMQFEEIGWGIGLIRLRIGIIGEPLWIQHWISGSHKPCITLLLLLLLLLLLFKIIKKLKLLALTASG